MQDFRKLRVWQLAQDLALEIYRCSSPFPKEELYGMTMQIRRAAVSVGSNIAEGSERVSVRDKAHFFNISQGSAAEVISLLDIARRLGCLSAQLSAGLEDRNDHVAAMLELLRRRVKEETP